jgi:predicted ATPase/DNA-binding SARP family transcriptional activator
VAFVVVIDMAATVAAAPYDPPTVLLRSRCRYGRGVQFRVLGPLEVDGAGSPSPPGGKERLVLLCLLLDPGRPVSTDALLENVWPGLPRETAARSLSVRLATLRRFLGPTPLRRAGTGYVLDVAPGQVDARRFESLLTGASSRPAADGLRAYEDALALWRGGPFEELAHADLAQAEIRRLEELHRQAQEGRARALVELGRVDQALPLLERLAAEDPLREEVVRTRMLALYRAGRQVDALAAYRTLADALLELGLQPGDETRELERRILAHEVAPAPLRAAGDGPPSPARGTAAPLPVRASRFLGREAHLARAAQLLAERPLVTIAGVGGVGKTRLAAELAAELGDRFPDGVWWCELAPVALPADVTGAVADAVGFEPVLGTAGLDRAAEHLASRRGLLVLDNCEHVLDGAAEVAERLLAACPDVRVLATSRAPLGVDGEEVLRLAGLELPAGGRPPEVGASAAVALFLDRARAAGAVLDPGSQLDAVAEICRRLDGLPLAIELAAGRARSLTPADIAARLDELFGLLKVSGRRAAPRHRTLEAAIDWSYRLLDEPQRRLFERLSVFARGAGLEAVEDVCSGDGVERADVAGLLDQLVAHSLVTAAPVGGRTAYGMLETLREYAAGRLAQRGEQARVRDRHVDRYVTQAEAAIQAATAWRSLLPFIDEFDDVRAAVRWCAESDPEPRRAFTILVALWGLAPARHAEEIALLAEEALERWPDEDPLRLHVLGTAATARLFAGDPAGARRHGEAAVALEERAGETALLGRRALAHLAMYSADPREAATLTEDVSTRARAAGQEALALECDGFTVQLLHAAGDVDVAVARAERMRADADRMNAPFMACWARYVSGVVHLDRDPGEARRWLVAAIALGRDIGHHHMVRFSLRALGVAALLDGAADEAAEHLLSALEHDEASTDAASQWTTLAVLGLLLAERGRLEPAAELLAAAKGWPAAPFLVALADIAREQVAAGLPAEVRMLAEQRGHALDLDGAKALTRTELAAPGAGGRPRPAASRAT